MSYGGMGKSGMDHDKDLFTRIAAGDEAAFNQLYDEVVLNFTPYIYKLLQSQDAVAEVLQEALIRFWFNRHKLPDIDRPKAWLLRIISNESYRYLRKQILREAFSARLANEQAGSNSAASDLTELDVSFRETQRIIRHAVSTLSPRQQSIYRLSRERGLNDHEIAAELGVSYNYVRKTLAVALRNIQKRLVAEGRMLPMVLLLAFH